VEVRMEMGHVSSTLFARLNCIGNINIL